MKIDVLLLADIMENFRILCLRDYSLDPVYYFSLSNFSWDACLKYTKIELELLTDYDMHLMFEKSKRGGVSTTLSKRYAQSDPEAIELTQILYRGEEVPERLENTLKKFLLYLDANNLYGHSMSQTLPIGKFRWVTDENKILVIMILIKSINA